MGKMLKWGEISRRGVEITFEIDPETVTTTFEIDPETVTITFERRSGSQVREDS
jgi:hypothetical protein